VSKLISGTTWKAPAPPLPRYPLLMGCSCPAILCSWVALAPRYWRPVARGLRLPWHHSLEPVGAAGAAEHLYASAKRAVGVGGEQVGLGEAWRPHRPPSTLCRKPGTRGLHRDHTYCDPLRALRHPTVRFRRTRKWVSGGQPAQPYSATLIHVTEATSHTASTCRLRKQRSCLH
jgi:hypothetical protein